MTDEFQSWRDYWRFSHSVRHSGRFIHEAFVGQFLQTLADTCGDRVRNVSKGSVVWRAQLGNEWHKREQDEVTYDEEVPYPSSRMKPLRHTAHEGRVNPKGLPCLYVASDRLTAMSEVRPWIGANISVAAIEITKDLKLVDFSVGHEAGFPLFLEDPDAKQREKAIWNFVDRAFSVPVNPDPVTAEYVPTQIIAEYFKKQGMDGVVYKSSLGAGYNLAIFDLDVSEVRSCTLYPVKAVSFEFGDAMIGYSVLSSNGYMA